MYDYNHSVFSLYIYFSLSGHTNLNLVLNEQKVGKSGRGFNLDNCCNIK